MEGHLKLRLQFLFTSSFICIALKAVMLFLNATLPNPGLEIQAIQYRQYRQYRQYSEYSWKLVDIEINGFDQSKIILIFSLYPGKCLKVNQWECRFQEPNSQSEAGKFCAPPFLNRGSLKIPTSVPFYLLNILEGSDRYLLGLLSPSSSSLSISSSRNIQI